MGMRIARGIGDILFLNNDQFVSRRAELRLDGSIGLEAKPGTTLRVVSQFPEKARLLRPDGEAFQSGRHAGDLAAAI